MDFNYLNKVYEMSLEYAPKVVGAILTLIIGFWIIGWITKLAKKALQRNGVDETVRPFLGSLVNVGLKVLLLLSVAKMFGIDTTSFVAIFGALAFAIGLALQGSLGHFASGVLLLVFRPYKVGDLVDLGGKVGNVEEIQVFNTVLVTLDNKRIIIPNGVVTSGVITNISGQGEIGVDLTFGAGYKDDIDTVKAAIRRVIASCPHALKEKSHLVEVVEHGASAVKYLTRTWCKSEHYWDVYFFMNEHIKKEFDKSGISIPYPQMDVHLDK